MAPAEEKVPGKIRKADKTNTQNRGPGDFPGGPMNRPPASAGEVGSTLVWSGPHALEQLSPCSRTSEPERLSLHAATTDASVLSGSKSRNYRNQHALEPVCCSYRACVPQGPSSATGAAAAVRRPRITAKSNPCFPKLEKACVQQ